jgi:hypothetical protein
MTDSTFGEMFSGPDMAPAYAASVSDDSTWAVVDHREEGRAIVAGLTEAQALTIAAYLEKRT